MHSTPPPPASPIAAFAVALPPAMRLKRRGSSTRRVFFAEAIRRIRLQTFSQRLRSVPYVLRLAFDQVLFLLFTGLPITPRQLLALYARTRVELPNCAFDLYGEKHSGPLIVFVHGGAWGGSNSLDHALLGKRLAAACNAPVAIADQRVYPAADMREQAVDVADIVFAARARFPDRRVILAGHSSGAHSVALAIADGLSVHSVVLEVGVFDPLQHFTFESVRGLETVSSMLPAGRADEDVTRLAEFSVMRCFRKREPEDTEKDSGESNLQLKDPLEGDIGVACIGLQRAADVRDILWEVPGGTFIMGAGVDCVVPLSR